MKLVRTTFFFSVLLFNVACNNAVPIEVNPLQVKAEATGPLFSGINTATADFKISEILPDGVKQDQIAKAQIKSITLRSIGEGVPNVLSYTALLASPNQEMSQVAFLNDQKTGEVSLTLAEDQSFVEAILRDPSQTLVIDFDLSEDYFDNWTFDVTVEWDLSINQ